MLEEDITFLELENFQKQKSLLKIKIIDYGFKYWSEDLDIGLAKFCSFVISNGSGAESIADNIFNKPILLYSYVPMGFINTFASKCMYLPKNHYFKNSKKENEYKSDL